ncbi:MAG: hypothetical protein ABI758_02165 [Candidatus Woesebacteria bacterium]
MKKSKLMVLYLFSLGILAGEKVSKAYAYIELYERLPLAPSTVRGIVMEFLNLGFIEEQDGQEGKTYQITKKGLLEAYSVFQSGIQNKPEECVIVISGKSIPKILKFGFFSIKAGVYLRFGSFHREELGLLPRKIYHSLLIVESQTPELLPSYLTEEYISTSTVVTQFLKKLIDARSKKNHRVTAAYRLLLKKSFEGIIDLLSRNYRIPEEYYPQNCRLSTLNHLFLRAII